MLWVGCCGMKSHPAALVASCRSCRSVASCAQQRARAPRLGPAAGACSQGAEIWIWKHGLCVFDWTLGAVRPILAMVTDVRFRQRLA